MRLGLATLVLFGLVGCATRVPETPLAARAQAPRAGAAQAWRGRGRFTVDVPGHHLDAEFAVRADPGDATHPPEIRLVVLTDSGVQLADVSLTPSGATVHRVVPDLQQRAALLARLLDPWLPAAPEVARRWDDARLVEHAAARRRWYGGDPLLLRLVDGDGWPLLVSDYRPLGDELLARQIIADGPWSIGLSLRLVEARSSPPLYGAGDNPLPAPPTTIAPSPVPAP